MTSSRVGFPLGNPMDTIAAPSSGDELRVLVVGDDPLARAGLVWALAGAAPSWSIEDASGVEGLESRIALFGPDVVVWDAGADPARALGRVADLGGLSSASVVLVPEGTSFDELIGIGARGAALRRAEGALLSALVRAVAAGLWAFDPALAPEPPVARTGVATPAERLTPRESEVLTLLADGLSNKQIGVELGISDHTVKFHVNSILDKLGAETRTEAVVRAARLGLVAL
ncbi:MAG: response regulator transcription factor [Polyangiaceae bacterium]|nr:response regulator transcription factor [Polyangiaceae bacterium]